MTMTKQHKTPIEYKPHSRIMLDNHGETHGVGGSPANEGVGVSREVGSLPKVCGIDSFGLMDIRVVDDILDALICDEDSFGSKKSGSGDIEIRFGDKVYCGLSCEEFRDFGNLYFVIRIKE
jgi:hypothetical protein